MSDNLGEVVICASKLQLPEAVGVDAGICSLIANAGSCEDPVSALADEVSHGTILCVEVQVWPRSRLVDGWPAVKESLRRRVE